MPLTVPGAEVSPGANNCSFVNVPALMVIEELVLGVLVPSVTSLAVIVRPPAVLQVTVKVCVPPINEALAGNRALLSLEVILTVSVAVEMIFQFASTALTVTLNEEPEV